MQRKNGKRDLDTGDNITYVTGAGALFAQLNGLGETGGHNKC